MQSMVSRTKVTKAHTKFEGLRTAIPWEYVVDDLQLKEGDYLIWEWRVVDGEKVLIVRKDLEHSENTVSNTVTSREKERRNRKKVSK